MRITRTKWSLPTFALALVVVIFVAQWIGGDPGNGLVSLAILAGFGVLVLIGGRSETVRGLRGDGRDERFGQIDIHATALAGLAIISAASSRSSSKSHAVTAELPTTGWARSEA